MERAMMITASTHDVNGHAAARPTLDAHARAWLRAEGLAAFIAGMVAYGQLGGEWIWLLPALLVPDASALGYLGGPRLGAITYNLVHNWAVALAVLGAGLAIGSPILALAGTVLVAHTGMDRALGYGLKLMTGFRDTHLGRIGRSGPDR